MDFGFATEGIDVVKHFSPQVKGRTFLITGTSAGGIGAEAAISLAHGSPAMLILLGRSPTKSEAVISAIKAVDSAVAVKFVTADLSSLSSVRAAAESILADPEVVRIDVLINNAAIMMSPFSLSVDGIESQLATGHAGHFLLTNLLMPKLQAAAAAAGADKPVRIVNVASSGNKMGGIRWTDPNFSEPGSYAPIRGYGQVKTANVLFSLSLNARRLAPSGRIRAYSLHPGSIVTGLQKFLTPELVAEAGRIMQGTDAPDWRLKTLQQGCSTTLRAALDPGLEAEDGVFLSDCQLTTDPEVLASWAVNPDDAERLWGWSEKLVGQEFVY